MSTTPLEQASRDIAAALSDLRGRRDQVVADLDERIGQLELLSGQLEQGSTDPRQVQERVRRLIGDRSPNPAARVMRAGRTQIGMRLSGEHTPVGPPTTQNMGARLSGPSSAMATATLHRALSLVDARVVTVLSMSLQRDEARLELATLRRLRRSIDEHLASVPEDVVLVTTLVEHADDAMAVVADLDQGGQARVRRLLEYARELVSQVTALGGNAAGMKEIIQRARAHNDQGNTTQALTDAVSVFMRLQGELARRAPTPVATMLDELVRA
jgi:hypothetical protein